MLQPIDTCIVLMRAHLFPTSSDACHLDGLHTDHSLAALKARFILLYNVIAYCLTRSTTSSSTSRPSDS